MTASLEVRNVSVSAGALRLVRDLSFRVEAGHAMTILGESGSGKSLLAQAIMGTLPPELSASGEIAIAGTVTPVAADRSPFWGRTLALLPQEPWLALDPTMRVIDQVAEGYRHSSRAESRAQAHADLKALGLEGAESKFPFQLSGGMAQRVAFVAALAGGAEILVVDEPTKGLDARLRDSVVGALRDVVAQGRTLITITHDVQVARALGGSVTIVREGEIVEAGHLSVLDQPAHEYTRALVHADPASWATRPAGQPGAEVLSARRLAKRFGPERLFEDVDVEILAGDRVAITGDSGSGKTTLGNILIGLLDPDSGRVTRAEGLHDLRFQKLYQDPPSAFAPRATMRRLLEDVVARHRLEWSQVAALMTRLRLPETLLDRRAAQLSGGELQRFALVRLLLLNPAVVLADEPTSRLDPITQKETIDLLVEQTAGRNCALLLITHDPAIARNVASGTVIEVDAARSSTPR